MKLDGVLPSLIKGDRRTLAKCITLVESKLSSDRMSAAVLIDEVLPHAGNSLRIGISGVPGVGKSTFIESFGLYLISLGKRVAVLAVDPSSPIAGGSILGDKTRMQELSRSDAAFIRPSPSSGMMGGLAQETRESILLCEAAGYDIVLVETVGVGQVEVDVNSIVDFFMLLMVPNAGDDLQGIKRGITELVDAVVINKADGTSTPLAMQSQQYYQSALNILRSADSFWTPRVLTCSALENQGLEQVWQMIEEYELVARRGSNFELKRQIQNVDWLKKLINTEIQHRLLNKAGIKEIYPQLEADVQAGITTPLRASQEIIQLLFGNGQ